MKQWLEQRAADPGFGRFLAETCLELCRIDTIPTGHIADTARREGQLLDLIEELIGRYALPGRLERRQIPESIAAHPFYTVPHYAGRSDAYAGRSNLLYLWDAPPAARAPAARTPPPGVAVNAHIDTVAPYFTPRLESERLFGRGACDDKGGCTVMVGALRLLAELERRFDAVPACDLTFMFVIDEEMGGNGSLALALDEPLGLRYGSLAVLECCDGQVHPAGRGAVWYRVEIPTFPEAASAALSRHSAAALALQIILSMDREGEAIRAESDHPLFSPMVVQTSPGVLGQYGEHPARVCASVTFILKTKGGAGQLEALLQSGLAGYVRRYGDKTRSGAGLKRHYDLRAAGGGDVELQVHGISGHMGALFENDNALIKAAYLLEPLTRLRGEGGAGAVHLAGGLPASAPLLLEGGQGFLPTHSMESIKSRLSRAVQQAYRSYARSLWKQVPYFRDTAPRVSFVKLHNEAFQSNPDSPAVLQALQAAAEAGITLRRPPRGWEVSSDARIFAHLRPELPVFTTGPGKLALAHSDQEQITIGELASGSLMLALFLLRRGGIGCAE